MSWLYSATGDDVSAAWNGRYRGAAVFLCCGGPSLTNQPLDQLRRHGILTAAVNNAPIAMWRHGLRPQLWFCADRPSHFHPNIWTDPGCAKFCWRSYVRDPKLAGKNRIRHWNGKAWEPCDPATKLPNVWCYEQHEQFNPASWLDSPWPTWGTRNGTDPTGRSCRSVLLIALWSLWKLGFSRVYLVGCDFGMLPDRPYAWEETKTVSDCNVCNRNFYRLATDWLPSIEPRLREKGCQVIDCGTSEVLTCFERSDLAAAVATEGTVEPFAHTAGLYAPH